MEPEVKVEPAPSKVEERASEGLSQLKAIIIGVNNYLESNPLAYCINDANALASLLSNGAYTINDKKNIKLMTDESGELDKPIRSNILNNLSSLSKSAQPTDTVLFFFAGHGDEIENEAFIMPSDFRREAGKRAGISINDIKKELVESKARLKILLFDACHSGSIKDRAETGKMSATFYNALLPSAEGFAVASACSQDENSHEWDKEKHGVFTYYLLQGLEGQADMNFDGLVDLSELYSFITPQVQEWAFQNNTVQTPVIKSNYKGLIYLTKAETQNKATPIAAVQPNFSHVELVSETEQLKQNEYEAGMEKETVERLNDYMAKISADLLDFYEPSDLTQDGDTVLFPDGYLRLETETDEMLNSVKMLIRFYLSSKLKIDTFEKILTKLDDYKDLWHGIGTEFTKCKYDLNKLKSICENKGFEKETFKIRPVISLTVTVSNWLSKTVHVTFVQDENAFVGITANTTLPQDFYAVLNPKNILDVIGQALVSK